MFEIRLKVKNVFLNGYKYDARSGEGSTKKILERHAAKLRSFVPKPVEREEESVKLPSIHVSLW